MTQDMKVYGKFTDMFKYTIKRANVLRSLFLLFTLMTLGATNALGITITYHIINLGKLDNNGNITTTRTEALQFTSTETTLGVPAKYKSPLAKNWKYYQASEVTYNSGTKVCTFNSGPTLSEGDVMAADAHIYVTYELDETALTNFGVIDGGVCYIKFGNNKYLRQSVYSNQPNTDSDATLAGDGKNLWKINIKDPYQITIQSKSTAYTDYYLSADNGKLPDIRLKSPLGTAKNNKVWAFGLLPGGVDNTYRLIVTDAYTQNNNTLDSFKHGYLNNYDQGYKTRFSTYDGENHYNCNLTFEPQTNTYTYHIIDTKGNEAISYTMPAATPMGQALSSYTDIPAPIRSPYLAGETVKFYNNSDHSDAHKITETPTTGTDIYVTYTTDKLGEKFLHLRGARTLNVTINNDYIYDDEGTLKHLESPEEGNLITQPYLWYFSGGDPYAIEISNSQSSKKLGYATSPTSLLYEDSPEKTKFIIMNTYDRGDYQQMELMAATGDGTYYHIGRTDDNFNLNTTHTGTTIKVYPNSAPVIYKLIDKAGKILATMSSKSGAVELPDDWKSPLVSEYQYWKESAFIIEGDVYTLKAEPDESDKVTSVTDVSTIYVTYKVNNKVDFRTTDDTTESITDEDRPGSTYRLQFVNGEIFNQEDGKDAVMTTAQKAVYPYFCGDGMFYVYGDEQWNTQLNSGASTRSRWLWYVVSPTSDPYHVKIMTNQLNAKPINTSHGYFRTFPVTYKDLSTRTNVTRYVTSLTTTAEDAGAPSPTEYMVLTGVDGHCKLVTVNEFDGAPENGSLGTRQTVKTLEQYWKNNPTVQNTLGGAKVTQEETYSDNITLTSQQENNLPDYWHTYQTLANSAPWVGWTGDNTGTGRQYKNKNHWFQTVNMSTTPGSDGEFEFIETTLTPQVILIDNHGWEIMRKPLYDKDGNVNTELKLYDSPMVQNYYWHPTSTKADGYHKYNINEGDEVITIYYKNDAGKWVPDGNTTTFTSNSLYDDPYVKIKNEYQEQDASVKTDFYITYDVKPEYANLYRGADTESEVTVSAFWVKQGTEYAKNQDNALTTTTVETDDDELKWNVKPNFNIDAEMGYHYNGEYGEKSKDETEAEYVAAGKNGFDPYNIQIQSVSNPFYYFKTNTTGSQLSGGWSGTSTNLSLQQMSQGGQNNVAGNDQTKLTITNATFMVVKDESDHILLMPRFDHTKVVNSFSGTQLSAPNAASQTLELKMAPKVIHYSSEFASMNGQYFLADDFEFVEGFESLGSAESPFTGSIDGGLHPISTDPETPLTTPLIAYAEGAIIKNVILDNVNITTGTNVGAIVANATGETRIYNCGINSGSVGGSGDVGGIVGSLDGSARVINCYSYATITGGTNVGGIVGNNKGTTTAGSIKTMVMNCMFYGDITGGTNKSPVYGGNNIANLIGSNRNLDGLNTFNYYAYQKLPTAHITDGKYNSALAIYEKYLNRFEFYRLLLNSNKKLAAYYATSSKETVKPSDMMKWVLETADRSIAEPKPYPVLKSQGYYPSIINYDAENAPDSASVGRNHGGKLGKTLRVHLSGTGITTFELTLQRMDKDFDRFNFNYDKVQLPYFNEVGTGNYTNNQVVTGWEITGMDGGTAGTYSAADEFGGYNFADRKCTNKDLFSLTGRVFSQGAYFDVPYGVTDIYIQPHWATAVYVADEYLDVVYNTNSPYGSQKVTKLDKTFPNQKITINGSEQDVYTSISAAIDGKSSSSVYDLAVVLVGNLHQSNVPSDGSVPFTVMSADLDNDHEPDYSMIYHHNGRTVICPIRFDFLNIPGTCQAQKPNGVSKILNFTIFKTKGWFETTNTCLVYSNQVEYENRDGVSGDKIANSPLILLGGDFEQFVSTQKVAPTGRTNYIHVGSNVNIDNFGLGTHGDGANATPHIPVSVTGGEFKGFYLTGTYNPNAAVKTDNAECYISGGHFVEAAGACQEQINGNVQWQIYEADIDAFFGGGINDAKPITGTITTEIINSHVGIFCGGPKFGNMTTGKDVTTTAVGCIFDEYFGAGYGGLSYSRQKYSDERTYNFNSTPYQTERGLYYDGEHSSTSYGKKGPGVATDFDYEFFVWSSGETGSRKYVKFASFSLAQCNDVSSNLTNCTINQSFYGGGSLGKVTGKATSVLDGCTVHGNVFGGGFSANVPKVPVRDKGTGLSVKPSYNSNIGMFEPGEFSGTTNYEWKHVDNLPSEGTSGFVTEEGKNYVVTSADLTTLGQVKETDLTVKNNCSIGGAVYGGGDESSVNEHTLVKIQNEGGINKIPNVYGGGNTADVDGNTEVHMMNGTVSHDIYGGGRGETTKVGGDVMVNIGGKTGEAPSISYSGTGLVEGDVYGGSALGAVNTTADKTTTVNVYGGTVNGSVFGGGLGQKGVAKVGEPGDPGYVAEIPEIVALSQGNTTVNIEGGTVKTAVYGGSNVNGVLQKDATVTLIGGTVGDSENQNRDVVFGGGKGAPTLVNGNVMVNVGTMTPATPPAVSTYTGNATIHGHVYGGGELGNTNASKPESELVFDATKKTRVNLYAGTINGYAYGGALGSAETPAYVGGESVIVTLDGAKVHQVFGANNINGTPKGHVLVHVKRTTNFTSDEYKENTEAPRTSRTTYDVQAVYGGGNMADYVPTDACLDPAVEGNPAKIAAATAEVLIEGCQKTSINYVYGGGNAAAVPATDVTVKGTYIINTLYGGGNGSGYMDPPTNSIPNPGANIGIYKNGETPTNYGTGKAVTKLLGGYINNVYGGSNTKGDVRGGTDVSTKKQGQKVTGDCCSDLYVGEIYGAGSHADVKGDVNITLDCLPDEFVDAVYGGAEEAVIEGNVTLTVTSGRFGRVFGGNNKGGNIQGSITVNIYEDGCKPLIIGEVYGGGNAAPYSIYGCSKDGGTWTPNTKETLYFNQETEGRAAIQVNIIACTSVGKVFGGGMGSTAKVIGNTNVDVNLLKGIVEGVKQSTIGKVGQVFGGGGEADVIGNTLVEVGTKLANEGEDEGVNITRGTYTSSSVGTYLNPEANEFIDMPSAGIYGGGLSADVDGNTTLNIGTKDQRIGEEPSVTIAGDIFGGGLGKDTHVTGNVTVNIGADTGVAPAHNYVGYAQITGDVYGGSAKGTVNSKDNITVNTYIPDSEHPETPANCYTKVNFYGGAITGNIYGGGEGQIANPSAEPAIPAIAANVFGPVTVTMLGGSVYNVFGCNNYNGAPKSTVTVNINGGTVNFSEGEIDGREGNVYGGGNQAAYTAPDGNKDNPVVNVNNGTITRNVFGGGLGTTATVTGNPHVTIGDNVEGHVAAINWSVYGGGSLATVDGSTYIFVNSGTIGTPKDGETVYGGAKYGNIYGGGFGSSDNVRIGLVKGNTNVTVNGGNVLHNIYGGGAYGSVGTYTYASEEANAAISSLATANTGKATIRIVGGTIGTDGHENGMIFGASRGDIDRPGVIQDNMAWVYDTEVIIGTEGQGEVVSTPSIKGSVYGSGENGHTYHDAAVAIHSGMVGITDVSIDGGAAYPYRGNVYGGGCGTDKYYADQAQETHDGKGTLYNPTAGIVRGNAMVTIDGGHVVRNVYGAGAMGSVTGQTTVNISGKSIIGADGSGGGYVYAAARGADDMSANCATVGSTALNISGGTVWGSAFGGGQLGTVKGSVAVNVSGGVVKNDVYGGGALANTNTDNWNGDGSIQYVALTVKADPTAEELAAGVLKTDVTPVAGYFTEAAGVYTRITNPDAKANGSTTYYKKAVKGTWADDKTSASNTTTVRLTGGLIGNAYGGGLGNSTTMANVYGDVTVTVNEGITDPTKGIVFNQKTEHPVIGGTDYPTPVMGRVFGCNNYNGTPTGEVTVHVYSTRQIKKDTEGEILPGHGSTDRKFPYEIQSVYGGGNQADYLPATGKKSHVIIDGCDETSIEKVYGGCNSAVIPETDVLINGCYDIGYGFGGGNGGRPIKKEDGNWYENEGAIVIGTARIECRGGKIGQVFGGGDSKGSCGNTAPVIPEQGTGTCPLWITRLYGAGNEGDVTHVNIILAACSGNAIEYVHGGSYNAHVHGNINLTITSGILKNVYGGNDSEGGIEGDITVNIEETDGCNPIIIQNLVGGGNEAAFPGTLKPGGVETPINRHGKITVNVKSATRIDNIYGGSFNAEADADTEININMMKGNKAGTTVDIPKEFSYIPNITKLSDNPDGKTIHCTIDDAIGTIGNVFGGGKQGIVKGNTQVNINSAAKVYIMKRNGSGQVLDTNGNPITTASGQNIPAGITIDCTDAHDTKGAHITGNVFGGGENADVTGSERASDKGNSFVNICANPDTYAAVAEGTEKVTIGGSVYGGGSEADVHTNTRVTMAGGYVYDGVYGGGLMGSVGTYTRDKTVKTESNGYNHSLHSATCVGKPTACTSGGTCTVVVSGGQVGPLEVATKGMKNVGGTGPVDVGFVFGAGRGEVEDPDVDKDADFHTYVNKTDVTISGGIIMASVYGGGENGRVLGDTHVKIQGGQIGSGDTETVGGKTVPRIYTESEWANASVETAATFKECLSWDFKSPFLPYDPYGGDDAGLEGTDGHTYYGSVFGGGSGYFPYKKADGTHDWLRSAGQVFGNTVIDITGGHILTCVYGGNETTDVGTYSNNAKGQPLVHESGGKCTINMVGGTLGVPRTEQQMKDHPVTCYLFGAGKGDQRTHFNTWTNVQETEVNVSGTARIFGSVFGGGEDGHILGNAQVNIGGEVKIDLNGDDDTTDEGETFIAQSGLKIGTTGTSYVDGNVFGGGRGFSGEALTAGSVHGNIELTINGGTMLGSVYGGGRLASVGIDMVDATLADGSPNPAYGLLKDDTDSETCGHITVSITGGTIGNDVAGAEYGGNVFGGSMGRLTLLDGTTNPQWPKLAASKLTNVTIRGGTIKRNVYGGSEYGIVRNRATVNVSGGTINGSVFGSGRGSEKTEKQTIAVAGYDNFYYTFTPMLWAGCVSGSTFVIISGGTVKKNVYGGGELASVGLIDFVSDASGNFTNMTKHESLTNGFGLSWPYEFHYHAAAPSDLPAVGGKEIGGKATVTIIGGKIGDASNAESGYVFGGGMGKPMERYTEAFMANVRETEVSIKYASTATALSDDNCITGAVYGGGENGHVYENSAVNITGGLIGYSVYGGGKGVDKYKATLKNWKDNGATTYETDIYSITAGKVYGNTSVTMSGGHVMRNVYGGGYMASVGKGNYAGGADDYSDFTSEKFGHMSGYGETITGNLWDGVSENSQAFLNSGKATVTITGGTVGTPVGTAEDEFGGLPTGNVIGGSKGEPAPNIFNMPVHEYNPTFHVGNINEAEVIIGDKNNIGVGPRIYASVYGGGQDGHMRRDSKVTIYGGEIGLSSSDISSKYANDGTPANTLQWEHRGNVYGSGSGIGKFEYDYNGNETTGADQYYEFDSDGDGTAEKHYEVGMSHLAGCVARFSEVNILGGTIHRSVYGGGSVAGTGMPKFYGQNYEPYKKGDTAEGHGPGKQSQNTVTISGGTIGQVGYGGNVFGASRGKKELMLNPNSMFATSIWSDVSITGGTIYNNVYGGGELGSVTKDTNVQLTGGEIKNNAYGGGKGIKADEGAVEANIGGNTTVELNKGKAAGDNGCIVKRIFGCNDLNGTPKGHVLVHVYATQHTGTNKIVPAGGKYTKFNKLSEYTMSNYTADTNLADLKSLATAVGLTSGEVAAYETAIAGAVGADAQKAAIDNYIEGIATKKYDVLAVYGGGDLAPYVPADPTPGTPLNDTEEYAEVIIEGCDLTSIKQVYGGSNAASVPATKLTINSAYEIHESFGGGNGKDNYELDTKWYENPGANIGYSATYHHNTSSGGTQGSPYAAVQNNGSDGYDDATTKEARIANYAYGTGRARIEVYGGRIHRSYGGSNERGNIRYEASSAYEEAGSCPMIIDETYGGGKNAETDADIRTDMECVDHTAELYGGSTSGDVNSNIVLNITNGTFDKVYGGNKEKGRIFGSITVNVKETGCKPIIIDKLYIGGDQADYSIYGYTGSTHNTARSKKDYDILTPAEKAAITVQKDPRLNIISATRINNVYGGGYLARVVGSPHINVNMEEGTLAAKFMKDHAEYLTTDQTETRIAGSTVKWRCRQGAEVEFEDHTKGHNGILPIGTIGNIFGGGDQALVDGSTTIEIGTGKHHNEQGVEEVLDPVRSAAYITGRVYGGGNLGDVSGNATVEMGNGYVADRIYGGGKEGHVGTISTRNAAGKPTAFAENTGKTTVTISGGHVGPFEYSHLTDDEARAKVTITPMTMPQDFGYVFGGGRGELVNPATDPDINNKTYVNETEVTIKNGYVAGHDGEAEYITRPLIAGGVYGGSENGRVLRNTHVNIRGGQIGLGAGQTTACDEANFIDPATATAEEIATKAAAMPECAHWNYGSPWLPYDEHAGDANYPASTYGNASTIGSDGHTFYGNVFGGGSGYFAYAKGDGTYEWLPSAGLVEGDTYVNISGGHILTNVYGGNELTNVTGTAHVTMTGGTLGVPRTLAQIAAHPVTSYLFGAGKGDQRVHFNMSTNVGHAVVNVSGGVIYGSVFGGGEDGHVLGNVTMNIGTAAVGTVGQEGYVAAAGPTIGTWGTSYVEGNVFGGGRGFAGDALTAGVVCGNVDMNIKGGTMLGSIYGGGRLGSIGTHLEPSEHDNYGKLIPDNRDENYETGAEYVHEGSTHGYVTINISGGTIGNNNEYIIPQTGNIPSGLDADPKKWETADWTTWKEHNNVPNTDYVYDKDLGFVRLTHTKGGNVFAGAMGRMYALDGTTPLTRWYDLGMVKSTRLTITGGTIKSNVYGGGELGWTAGMHKPTTLTATDGVSTEILIQGGTIGTEVKEAGDVTLYTFGSVYGGGYGNAKEKLLDVAPDDAVGATNPKFIAGRVVGATSVRMEDGWVKGSIFGGGEVANVGLGFYSYKSDIIGGTKGGFKKDDSGIAKTGETITDTDIAQVSTYVDVSGGTVGIAPITVSGKLRCFGGATMGNVYGGGSGNRTIVRCGLVLGNSNVSISQAEGKTTRIYHNVYGGGSFGSVGDYEYESQEDPVIHTEKVYGVQKMHTAGTGEATVSITGGTIGSNGHENGMVFGSSRGDIANPHTRDNYMAWVNNATVTIGTKGGTYATPTVKGSVYGSGENGHTFGNTVVTVNSGTVGVPSDPIVVPDPSDPNDPEKATTYYGANYPFRGNVYGGGCGTDTYVENNEVKYNPEAGIVRGNTTVNINGGLIAHSVYGAGSMGSVGTITNLNDTTAVSTGGTGTGLARHVDETNGFALSWPYEFKFAENTGKATVNINGGHIGVQLTNGNIEIKGDGDVYGSARGEAGDRYKTAHFAYVRETEVNVNFPDTCTATFANYSTDLGKWCVTGSVHGSGENGYVYGDTHVTLKKGLIGHSLYGAGKGNGTYTKRIKRIYDAEEYDAQIYSLIAGRVMGNTYVTMNDGYVGRNVYGGGNMGSVGKGNYAGGTDDYNQTGYGEAINGKLWTSTTEGDNAWHFLNSGKTHVTVTGGIVGYIDETDPTRSMKNGLPYGNVFGGSAGEAAPNVPLNLDPRYEFCPAFFSGYVNETEVTIGKLGQDNDDAGQTGKAPRILGSVYGGGQDGHVRRWTHVKVNSGVIGMPFTVANKTLLQQSGINDPQWLYRGCVYGGGSGISEFKYDFNGDGDYDDTYNIDGVEYKEMGFSNSSGSVTCFTTVDVLGGLVYRAVLGGGSLGSVGAPKINQTDYAERKTATAADWGVQSLNQVNVGGGKVDGTVVKATIGEPTGVAAGYGGNVFGGGRGDESLGSDFGSSIWTKVTIKNGAIIHGDVFGGGNAGKVMKDTEVKIGE